MTYSSYYDKATSPDYWLKLNPDLHIEGKDVGSPWKPVEIGAKDLSNMTLDMVGDGYFTTSPLLDLEEVAILADAVEVLWADRWPTVFAMVYDEFWQVYQRASGLLEHMLGPGYKQLANYWVYYVANEKGSSGWAPHRDRAQMHTIRSDGRPNSMTIWIALTDATPLNGCMYVLPASFDPNYPHSPGTFAVPNVQDVRALPASAGSILSWNESLIHWGGRSSDKGSGPRISVACAFQRGDVDPYETPVLDPFVVPPLKQRLGLIGQQLYRFAIHTGMSQNVKDLAQQLGQLSETIVIYDSNNPYRKTATGLSK
ncbi:MAG: phytanoyl-CoA dioxygenase family protein [Candidatus Obscuribacterales bacterium]|nr:phytanoyl-CoA dioxygenase family protein [Candidatus Obscuribacterales bacterium]